MNRLIYEDWVEMEEIFVTRQAIYNSHQEVVGYELLFHDGSTCHAYPCSDAEQSAQLIVNTFMGIGLENLVGSSKAFINLSHDFFTHEHPIPMSSYQLVLEVSGACIEDEQVYQELKQLAKKGYSFSLYDYDYDEATAERLDCIDIVKLDIARYDAKELKQQTRYYRNHGKRIQIKGLATSAQQLLCSQLGIDYFQGTILNPVDNVRGRTTLSSKRLLQRINESAEQHPEDITTLIYLVSQDIALCYKLLRYINCASFSERTEIHSLGQALTLIGSTALKQWAALLLTAQPDETIEPALDARSLIRANMCRDLAQKEGTTAEAFIVGLLSTLGDRLETPLEDLLDALALSPAIAFALLFNEGPLGHLLQQVKHIEKEEWSELDTSQIARDDYANSYQLALSCCSADRV
jgi:EAL and modified HD-GYP domain-containing signal transduction protein